MVKIIRAFDVDEVLLDFTGSFLPWHNRIYGSTISKEDIFSYDLENVFGLSRKEMIRRVELFYNTNEFERIPAHEDAQELINSLKSGDVNIAITARPSSIEDITRRCLNKNFPDKFESVYLTNQYKLTSGQNQTRKGDICAEMNVRMIVEDSYANCLECAERGIKAFLIIRPWNKEYAKQNQHPLIYPVNSLRELINNHKFIS